MGAFNINITGVGGHGCERKAKAGEKLFGRCGRFTCPDCMAYEFVQRMKQAGMVRDGEQAYSVLLQPEVMQAIRDKNLWPGERDPLLGNEPNYVEVRDADILAMVPPGVTHIGVRHGASGIEAWASYPMKAEFTHWPEQPSTVVDDMLKNERKSGQF